WGEGVSVGDGGDELGEHSETGSGEGRGFHRAVEVDHHRRVAGYIQGVEPGLRRGDGELGTHGARDESEPNQGQTARTIHDGLPCMVPSCSSLPEGPGCAMRWALIRPIGSAIAGRTGNKGPSVRSVGPARRGTGYSDPIMI